MAVAPCMEPWLHAWLPGGFYGGFVIALDDGAWEGFARGGVLQHVCPSAARWAAVDGRRAKGVQLLEDPLTPVAPLSRLDLLGRARVRSGMRTVPELGCALSHYSVWAQAHGGTLDPLAWNPAGEWVLVLESDARADHAAAFRMAAVLGSEPFPLAVPGRHGPVGILKLAHAGRKTVGREGTPHPAIGVCHPHSTGTQAYLVRKSMVPRLLAALLPVDMAVDVAMASRHLADCPLVLATRSSWIWQSKSHGSTVGHSIDLCKTTMSRAQVTGIVAGIMGGLLLLVVILAVVAGVQGRTLSRRRRHCAAVPPPGPRR